WGTDRRDHPRSHAARRARCLPVGRSALLRPLRRRPNGARQSHDAQAAPELVPFRLGGRRLKAPDLGHLVQRANRRGQAQAAARLVSTPFADVPSTEGMANRFIEGGVIAEEASSGIPTHPSTHRLAGVGETLTVARAIGAVTGANAVDYPTHLARRAVLAA